MIYAELSSCCAEGGISERLIVMASAGLCRLPVLPFTGDVFASFRSPPSLLARYVLFVPIEEREKGRAVTHPTASCACVRATPLFPCQLKRMQYREKRREKKKIRPRGLALRHLYLPAQRSRGWVRGDTTLGGSYSIRYLGGCVGGLSVLGKAGLW